jgi:hypothetical protein
MSNTTPEHSYNRDVDMMMAAALAWRALHPDARPKFEFQPMGPSVLFTGPLDLAIDEMGVARNDEARDFLVSINGAVDGRATVLMAHMVAAHVFKGPDDV